MTIDLDKEIRAAIGDILDLADPSRSTSPATQLRRSREAERSWAPRFAVTAAAVALVLAGLFAINRHEPSARTGAATPSSATPSPTASAASTSTVTSSAAIGVWTARTTPPIDLRWNNLSITTDHGWLLLGGIAPGRKSGPVIAADGAYYDNTTGQWRALPTPPANLFDQYLNINAVWTGTEVVVVAGGDQPSVAAFDPSTFAWRTIPVPTPIAAVWPRGDGDKFQLAQVSYVADRVVILIPNDAEWATGASIFQLDPSTGAWKPGAPLENNGELFGAIASSPSQLFFLGGGGTSSVPCNRSVSLHTYNVGADTWSDQTLSDGKWQPAIMAWTGERLLLAGGRDCPHQLTRTAALLDPSTNTWTKAADLPTDLDSAEPSPAIANGWVVALGQSGEPLAYSPQADHWWTGPSALISGHAFAGGTSIIALGNEVAVWNPAVTDGPYMSLVIPEP